MTPQGPAGPPGEQPTVTAVRHLQTPAAAALADLAAIFDDLAVVLGSCERLLAEIGRGEDDADRLTVEALWTTALVSYARCFSTGQRGMGLTEADLGELTLEGEVVEWHRLLQRMRELYVDSEVNPRERLTVGAVQGDDGTATGVAIVSAPHPLVDEVTVRQTGRLAFELSQLVDKRMQSHQESVLQAAQNLTVDALNALPTVEVGTPGADGG